jgi:hypothetical protein
MAKAGEEPIETFQRLVEEIAAAGSTGEANALALEAFGARAGPDMAAAIREGRFELGELRASLAANSDTVQQAAGDTYGLVESLQMAWNRFAGVSGAAAEWGMALSGITAIAGPAISAIGKLTSAMSESAVMSRQLGQSQHTVGNAFAAAGVAVAGLGVAYSAYMAMMNEARETGARFADQIEKSTLGQDAQAVTVDRLRAQYTTLTSGINDVIDDYNGSSAPWDVDKRAEQQQWISDNLETAESMEQIVVQAGLIAQEYGVSEDAAASWLLQQYQLGTEFRTGREALDAYGAQVEENNGLTTEQTASIEESTAALQEWESALRAQFDPLIAMNQALRDQKTAQDEANAAAWEFGPASAEAHDANLRLAEANLTVAAAAAELQTGIGNGTISLAESRATLDGWVASGLITEEQAASVAWQFGIVTLAADKIPTNKHTWVTADTSQASAAIQALQAAFNAFHAGQVAAAAALGIPAGAPIPIGLGFDTGGVVPGPRGAARLAVVHGGETILPTHRFPLEGLVDGPGVSPRASTLTVVVEGRGDTPVSRDNVRLIAAEIRRQAREVA